MGQSWTGTDRAGYGSRGAVAGSRGQARRRHDAAIVDAGDARLVVVFVTADRCAPCQQYKHDALNDAVVIERLADPRFLPTHVEVDRSPEIADTYLGSRAIPMTYALRNGTVIATLRGQRSAADLLAWLDALPE